jgi:uncharacterized membrane protein YeaQ/YmgE (transglycosylase-associated protein family)
MPVIYWILVGLVVGAFTGRLMRFHTVNWGTPVDATIGAISGWIGAAILRGFGVGSVGTDWRDILMAAGSSLFVTYVCNELARDREEEIDERKYDPKYVERLAAHHRSVEKESEDTAA